MGVVTFTGLACVYVAMNFYGHDENEYDSSASSRRESKNSTGSEAKFAISSSNLSLSDESHTNGGRSSLYIGRPSMEMHRVSFVEDAPTSESTASRSKTSEQLAVQYSRQFGRNRKRRGGINKASADQHQAHQLAALLDQERGLPCQTKNGATSTSNLAELNYRERKRESLVQQHGKSMTPDEAHQMLMCKYMRLTRSNVEALKRIASFGGYDTQFHAHMSEEDLQLNFRNFMMPLRVTISDSEETFAVHKFQAIIYKDQLAS